MDKSSNFNKKAYFSIPFGRIQSHKMMMHKSWRRSIERFLRCRSKTYIENLTIGHFVLSPVKIGLTKLICQHFVTTDSEKVSKFGKNIPKESPAHSRKIALYKLCAVWGAIVQHKLSECGIRRECAAWGGWVWRIRRWCEVVKEQV